ncbi:2,3-bisphosphoglycerate-independent phosphoglycerate mutase [Legionella geestiana]|uniref:2,3-bisphosphoglycerate-independent phosphoglycerate mutase n=1 Tax=Legionella geestiana TaxID=45065 RepID=UPI001092ED03|nr:2,3-bisphosphoglycerate-independent phosphoglycerate mutase [Legionella geestiana]QDQ39343.1 2,3-bisphosphoglycerate-independent phosphoglycerate mutase [Legionella geestiana]
MSVHTPLVLLILDGWGYREDTQDNAIAAARTPQWNAWWRDCPHMLLEASGEAVGLPVGQMGNSEVGHMHIGAGRVIPQDFTRINAAIETGEFANNPLLQETLSSLKKSGRTLHVLGLLSDGGVHSHEKHLFAFLELCDKSQFNKVCLHLFLDGRDTPPQSAEASLSRLERVLEQHPVASIASISGRYYAMDRDNRWERVEPVYRLLVSGESPHHFASAKEAVAAFAAKGITDEFVPPARIGEKHPMMDGDAVFFFNYRADRARQLTRALVDDLFNGFTRENMPALSRMLTMTNYARDIVADAVFPPLTLHNTLGEVLAARGLSQLRLAETEKYAHVTWFFNGGSEQVFPNEDRILIPSPRVATYDLKPEMSATELTHVLVQAIKDRTQDVIICNYANADMVGHSGDFAATVKAIESIDAALHAIGNALACVKGTLLITADHGNAEKMFDPATKQAHTAHTEEPVPFVFVGEGWHFTTTHGTLSDIAPTVLTLLGITPPAEMTGRVLMQPDTCGAHT